MKEPEETAEEEAPGVWLVETEEGVVGEVSAVGITLPDPKLL